ncbi:MAG: acetyl-CoA hydrolase/transferase C-terminal domain-containing protein, partial [Candidatus Eisenbacteria bacterium]|nr:acetyl-CoA hydrolase/transferase C-terminal domain-containing protein [Candidatus Eisenbacteria bacterium]
EMCIRDSSATAQNGATSRIVPYLKMGAGVVTTRADVHYVVTEFGAAHIFGRNLRERAEALIKISHPKFRDELIAAAKERKLLP